MNSPIRRVAAGCLLLCLLLLANATYVQAFWADDLNQRSENRRVLLDEYSNPRGPILLADESTAAQSVRSEGEFEHLRQYANGPLYAPATGYYSYLYGRSAIERAQNPVLSGDDDRFSISRLIDLISGEESQGGLVKLTIDPAAQEAAWDALGDFKGAVVALDTETGAILAMVSKPSYDPNPLASHSVSEQNEAWQALHDDADKPGLNRAIAQNLPPGSVFKLVVAAAALESGEYEPDSQIPGPAEFDVPQSSRTLPNHNGRACGPNDMTTLENALRISCNTAFGYLGDELGDDVVRDQAERFGFNSQPLTRDEMNAATSVFPDNPDPALNVYAAIGQGDVRSTPLQIAMVSAAIANDGVLMTPHLVAETRNPDLVTVLDGAEPEEESRAMSPETAQQLTAMMVDVVDNGTGGNVAIDGIQVAGKTGTAQSAPERPNYAWFTSFAPADNPKVAVGVVVEEAAGVNEGEIAGNRLAAPIARDVMEAVLNQ